MHGFPCLSVRHTRSYSDSRRRMLTIVRTRLGRAVARIEPVRGMELERSAVVAVSKHTYRYPNYPLDRWIARQSERRSGWRSGRFSGISRRVRTYYRTFDRYDEPTGNSTALSEGEQSRRR